jgi:sugar lactone lactonase YvrE
MMLLCGRVALVSVVLFSAVASASSPTDAHASPALQTIAVVGGQPDDITVDAHGRLVWGDLARGTIERLDGKRSVTLVRGLSVPEGVASLPGGNLIVAEQGHDRIVRINGAGSVSLVYALSPVPDREGVDGIGRDARTGDLLIPDSPRGTLLRMTTRGRGARVIAQGLGRPVDATTSHGGSILVPDETLGTLVAVSPAGKISYRGSYSTPDDVSVDRQGTVWVTSLGDGGLWEIRPGGSPQRILSGLANPQGLTLDKCGDPIVVEQNTARIVRVLLTAASNHCAF